MFRIFILIILFSSALLGETLKLDSNQTNEILKHIRENTRVSWQNFETYIDPNLLKNKIKKELFVSYAEDTDRPAQTEFFRRFRTSNNSAQLRTSPTVDDQVIPNSCSSGQKIGNRIDQYDANVKGFALSQFSDENGAQWFFAILPSARAKRSYHIGWIEKKDLQFVDKTSVDR